jgi:hypothetical protein
MDLKDTAEELVDHFDDIETKRTVPTVPPAPRRAHQAEGALKPLEYLEHEHAAVDAVGFDAETAKSHRYRLCQQGAYAGTVAITIRRDTGSWSAMSA